MGRINIEIPGWLHAKIAYKSRTTAIPIKMLVINALLETHGDGPVTTEMLEEYEADGIPNGYDSNIVEYSSEQ